jgi:FkbM family methyltransferase
LRGWIAGQWKWFGHLRSILGIWGAFRYRLAEVFRQPTVRVTINGIPLFIRPKTPDLEVARESLGSELEPISHFLPHDFEGVIIDGGGYIGSAALKLSHMYPRAKIVSIEAAEQNFDILQRNVRNNSGIVTILAALAARSDMTLDLKDTGTGQWGFTTIPTPKDRPDAPVIGKVGTITIDEISRRYPGQEIGLIKLDIEGGEKVLFEECAEDLSKIPLIFVELHDRIVSGCSEAFDHLSKNRAVHTFGGEKYLSSADRGQVVSG